MVAPRTDSPFPAQAKIAADPACPICHGVGWEWNVPRACRRLCVCTSAIPAAPPEPATPAPADVNPKDRVGATKAPLTLLPPVAVLHGAHAMSNGAAKYGAYNWRGHPVIASIYLDACLRHVHAWHDGEERADDSGVHHLGHALACLAILLDAQATGNLVDDRPKGGGAFAKALVDVNAAIAGAKR